MVKSVDVIQDIDTVGKVHLEWLLFDIQQFPYEIKKKKLHF